MHDAIAPQDGEEAQPDPLVTALAVMVSRRIKEAKDAREASGIEQIWDEDADQYDGIDALNSTSKRVKDEQQKPREANNGRSKVFLNITKPKTDTWVARIQEMLVPNDDKPWEVSPTPIPELAQATQEQSQRMLTLKDGSQATEEQVAKTVMLRAKKAAEKMGDWIEDQFVQGGVYAEMRKVIKDAGRLGTGILKGPVPIVRTTKSWATTEGVTELVITEKTAPTSVRIDVRDFFPDPACGEDLHAGSYVVERGYMTARQLRQLAKLEDYDTGAIAAALLEGPRSRARDRDRHRDNPGETLNDSDVFEVYYYYGDVDVDTLLALNVDPDAIRPEDIALQSVPAVVTMLNDRPIKAAINPLETGEFPFDVFPCDIIEGQIWGRGVPRKMAVAQRGLNAGVRALMENAGLSAGAQIAITEGALTPADASYDFTGRKLWKFKPNEFVTDIRQAMQVWTIPSVQEELSGIIQFFLQMADELTNLPMLMQGQQGQAPELLGGMMLLLANAAAPLRVIAKQFDDYLVVRHLRRYYDWGMQSGPEEAKGDMEIKARGSTALLQRELAKEFLMQLYPISKDPSLRINPEKFGLELARSRGYDLVSIQYTDEEWQALQDQQASQPPPQDPRIEAAKIKADADAQKLQAELQDRAQAREQDAAEQAQDRALDTYINELKFQIQSMEFAGQKDISMAELKAMLATKAVDSRDKRDEMNLKMNPANESRLGI